MLALAAPPSISFRHTSYLVSDLFFFHSDLIPLPVMNLGRALAVFAEVLLVLDELFQHPDIDEFPGVILPLIWLLFFYVSRLLR
jgi:hypothetical protein